MQRLTLFGDLHLGERVRFFVEGISGVVGRSVAARTAGDERPD